MALTCTYCLASSTDLFGGVCDSGSAVSRAGIPFCELLVYPSIEALKCP